jgi:hypothetical protein
MPIPKAVSNRGQNPPYTCMEEISEHAGHGGQCIVRLTAPHSIMPSGMAAAFISCPDSAMDTESKPPWASASMIRSRKSFRVSTPATMPEEYGWRKWFVFPFLRPGEMVVRCMEIQNRPASSYQWFVQLAVHSNPGHLLCGPWLVVRSCIKKRTHHVRVVGSHFVADQSRWA